jgi:hypothetical protein
MSKLAIAGQRLFLSVAILMAGGFNWGVSAQDDPLPS